MERSWKSPSTWERTRFTWTSGWYHKNLEQGLEDVEGLLELAVEAEDEETLNEAVAELDELEQQLAKLEFRRMFSGEHDACDCYVDLQAGSGGTEAQDWTEMLLRMYLRWAESKGFKTELWKSLMVMWQV